LHICYAEAPVERISHKLSNLTRHGEQVLPTTYCVNDTNYVVRLVELGKLLDLGSDVRRGYYDVRLVKWRKVEIEHAVWKFSGNVRDRNVLTRRGVPA
jgi:hypothetical protein